jgi:CRISPR-associated protein Cas1
MSPSILRDLRWLRVRVVLRNTKAQGMKEHPLWVFHAALKYCLPRLPSGQTPPHWFRWIAGSPHHLREGADYSLDVFLPGMNRSQAEMLSSKLTARFFPSGSKEHGVNFLLVSARPPEERSIDTVLEDARWESDAEEVCLNFVSPLSFTPPVRWLKTKLEAPGLAEALAGRIERLFGVRPELEHAWEQARTLWHLWHYEEYRHQSKSSANGWQLLSGGVGPLHLRGPLEQLKPWLLLGAELGAGRKLAAGAGDFALAWNQPFFDPELARPKLYEETWNHLQYTSDAADEFQKELGAPEVATRELAESVATGHWEPAHARGFRVEKKTGYGERLVALFPPRDRLVQSSLHRLLSPSMDPLFEPQSHGFRPGRSVETARQMVHDAWREGYTCALESDIESFFDSVDWDTMATSLDAVLPRADIRTRALLHAIIRTPVRLNGRTIHRERGLLQGSPLSPLLANLYLDPFDEEMTRRGFRLVRYADDFVILCRSEDQAKEALFAVQETLGCLGLKIKADKTVITPFDAGFTFLGIRFGGQFDDALVQDAALQRTVFLARPHAWVGVDADAITVREETRLVARIPFRRVGEIVLMGAGGASTRLIERCALRNIPISFCSASGKLQNTLAPHDQSHYRRAAAHAQKSQALAPAHRLSAARAIVAAKVSNYLAWFRERPTAELRPGIEALETTLAALPAAQGLDALRGYEGAAARTVFRLLNNRAPSAFHSERRVPGETFDAWNSLLDFTYSLLFHRLNALIRLRGLDPYQGILHSPDARYESLICDLQEPFRARCDRFVLKLVNRSQITMDDFVTEPPFGPRLKGPAVGRFLELWATELDTQLAQEPATFARIIEAQVRVIQLWVETDEPWRLYHAKSPLTPTAAANPNTNTEIPPPNIAPTEEEIPPFPEEE